MNTDLIRAGGFDDSDFSRLDINDIVSPMVTVHTQGIAFGLSLIHISV